MKITLYYAPTTCALVPFVSLTEAGANFEVQTLSTRQKHQFSLEYLKINPKHKVPVLVVDGRPLTENIAINLWIAQKYPQSKLLPADPWQHAKAISLLAWCSSGIHPHLTRISAPGRFCEGEAAQESVRRYAIDFLFDCFSVADQMLDGKEFFFDHFTSPDAHFFWCFRRASQFQLDLSEFKSCVSHFQRMQERESVQKVYAFEKDVQASFALADYQFTREMPGGDVSKATHQ